MDTPDEYETTALDKAGRVARLRRATLLSTPLIFALTALPAAASFVVTKAGFPIRIWKMHQNGDSLRALPLAMELATDCERRRPDPKEKPEWCAFIWFRVAHIAQGAGRPAIAERAMRRTLVAQPSNAEAFVFLADLVRAQGERDEEELIYRDAVAAIEAQPAIGADNVSLIDRLIERGDLSGAQRVLAITLRMERACFSCWRAAVAQARLWLQTDTQLWRARAQVQHSEARFDQWDASARCELFDPEDWGKGAKIFTAHVAIAWRLAELDHQADASQPKLGPFVSKTQLGLAAPSAMDQVGCGRQR